MAVRSSVPILLCVLLSACVTSEERAAQRARAEQVAAVQRDARCASFGYNRGSPEFSKCLESMFVQQQQMAAIEEANRQARLQAAATGLQQAGAAMSAIGQPPPPMEPMRQPMRCNTIGTSTTCY